MTVLATGPVTDRPHWRLVAPWYRWERLDGAEPERAAEADRPVLQKYTATTFVSDFLADPQRCAAFDAAVDVHQRVAPIPMVDLFAPDGRLKSLSPSRLVPTTTRKLFLPAHQRFYLVAVGLHCDAPGFPRVDTAAVGEIGFVIRRQRAVVAESARPQGAALLAELTRARAVAQATSSFTVATRRARVLHPFARGTDRARVLAPARATLAAAQQAESARRRLQVWAQDAGVQHRTEAWVPTGDGTFGAWVPVVDQPGELVERTYPMRLLTVPPDDPEHAAHDGTIGYAAVPTASDEVTADGQARFSERDTYEICVYARPGGQPCPAALVWSRPSQPFRLASLFDPAGSAQRPVEIRMPDLAALAASDALPSVRVSTPAGSSLRHNTTGEIPSAGATGPEQICFFSIPLITIIAMFVLNLFLPIVMIVFGLWWMLKLKFCIPPSIEFEADLAAELNVEPPELELVAKLDIDVLPGVNQAALTALVADIFNPDPDPALDPVPADFRVGDRVTATFSNDPLVKTLVAAGYGRSADAAPRFPAPTPMTSPVRRDEVRHP